MKAIIKFFKRKKKYEVAGVVEPLDYTIEPIGPAHEEIKSVIRKLELALRTCELNDNKPEAVYRNIKDSLWILREMLVDISNKEEE